jgi:hypothetical protein
MMKSIGKQAAMLAAAAFLSAGPVLTGMVGTVADAQAVIIAQPAPPPLRAEVIPGPRRGYVWDAGHWRWAGRGYAWVPGHWRAVRVGARWAPGQWVQRGPHWRWREGYWVR